MNTELLQDASPVAQDPLPLLTFEGVSITYPEAKRPVLDGVNFSIQTGETLLFMGPSGCGKSTLAMLAAGLFPDAIEARVTGKVLRGEGLESENSIGYVFQDADAQFCMMKVGDELAFGLENLRVPRGAMPDRFFKALDAVGLDVPLTAEHASFSGGMKQKLAAASALAMDAKLVILDEPTANLDPRSTRQVFELIGDLRAKGQTMLIIEHKIDALLQYVDRVVLFDNTGHIHRVATVPELVSEEWEWLVANGVVAPWKQRLCLDVDAGSTEEGQGDTLQGRPMQEAPSKQCEPVIHVRGSMYYKAKRKTKPVWQGLDVEIGRGSFTAIVGPNGAGKSTFLQVSAGLLRLSDGETMLLGKPIRDWQVRERLRAVAYCFQNPEFQFIYERVVDELANRPGVEGVPDDVRALLEQFGLAECVNQSPFSLSQGQKRRLSVASMLRQSHELYLLDEPTFGQDARTQQVILDQLSALQDAGRTVVITTHDMDLVRRYATDVIVLAEGRCLFTGSPQALFERPDILESANLLDDSQGAQTVRVSESKNATGQAPRLVAEFTPHVRKTFAESLNPAWQMVASVAAIVVAMFAHTLEQGLAMFLFPTVLMMGMARLSPWQVLKRMSPFLIFYILYVWSLTAYGKVAPGELTLHLLWWHLSWSGFRAGLILALRMLGAVAFGILFFSVADVTDFVVSLSKNFRLKPKFAYGVLAGIRFLPMFQSEWTKLRQARQIRGKDAQFGLLRPITYALPLLSHAVRLSERVAIAMEARGFRGAVLESADSRTFYRDVVVSARDYVYATVVVAMTVLLLCLF